MSTELTFYHSGFERCVRDALKIYDRAITDEDALRVLELDCTNFDFDLRDYPVLMRFKKLRKLDMDLHIDELRFLADLESLEELSLEIYGVKRSIDFNFFSRFINLKYLYVSGGIWSDKDFINLEGLSVLRNLTDLRLQDIGGVDLSPLRNMPQLKTFWFGWANEVRGIDAIGSITDLETLDITRISVENLDFLDNLSDDLRVSLCSLKVEQGIDRSKLSRFKNGDFDDIGEF